jgi:SAM-dependent methyltransferase
MAVEAKPIDLTRRTTWTHKACASCGSSDMFVFYEVRNIPVHSVLLLSTREEALHYPTGDIVLAFCQSCGFIGNLAFDAGVHAYSASYEETQAFSSTFNAFHRRLANRLIERYDLRHKEIIEIGCGKGEFLTLLCELGENRGVGFDPAYVSGRNHSAAKERVTFIQDFYSEKYASYEGDFVCCKMTLEHISQTATFVSTIRRAIGNRRQTVVFFQMPEVTRILRELAFWDIYYEHCSYFSPGSLARLFRRCGFEVEDLSVDYDNQYLMIEARPHPVQGSHVLPQEESVADLAREVAFFADNIQHKVDTWRQRLQQMKHARQRVVIWGGGSKGVTFLTTFKVRDEVAYAVDINPYKHGTYMAGAGHEIVGPDFLRDYKPDVVIVMNPIYREDIRQDLHQLGLNPELMVV